MLIKNVEIFLMINTFSNKVHQDCEKVHVEIICCMWVKMLTIFKMLAKKLECNNYFDLIRWWH